MLINKTIKPVDFTGFIVLLDIILNCHL